MAIHIEKQDTRTVENLFYEQIKGLTLASRAESFDVQHSDAWI